MNILMTLANPFTHDPRVYNEARSLVKAGHHVTVLAWDKKKENPLIEIKDEINIVRCYNSKFMEILPYNIIKLYFWWNKGYKEALKLQKKEQFNVIHCHDLDTLPIGVKLKKKLSLPLIYDAHEIWGYMVENDIPKPFANYFLWKENHLLKYVDKIITVNEPLKEYFCKLINRQITIVMNCKSSENINYIPTKNKKFTIIYIGILQKTRFLLELIDLAKELPEINCIIAGKGKASFIEVLKNKCFKIQNVDFIGKIPMDEVIKRTKKADVIVCLFDPNSKNNQVGLPNKVFEAMVCGKPIICTKGIYSGDFVLKEKCGLAVNYNRQSLKEAIIKLIDNPKLCEELGKNGIKAAKVKYNWKIQEKKLLKIYKELK